MRTLYEALGVPFNVKSVELKEAWQELARKLHPDKGGDAEAFAEASLAYATLKDPKRRAAYNSKLNLLTEPCKICKGEGVTYKQKGFVGRVASKCSACNGAGRVARIIP